MSRRIPTNEAAELRRRAEQVLGPRPLAQSRSEYEIALLQLELELQHERLRITEAELAESRERFRHLYEHTPIGYATLDAFGRIEDANHKLCELVLINRGELQAAQFTSFMSDDDADRVQELLNEVTGDATKEIDVHLMRSDGVPVAVHLDIALVDEHTYRVAVTQK